MSMKFNDKDFRLSVRLTKQQNDYLEKLADDFNIKKSDALRMCINLQIYSKNDRGYLYEYKQTDSGN